MQLFSKGFILIKTIFSMQRSFDRYTAIHQLNVSFISGQIAKELGMTKKHISQIKMCALVHDIGKISIPISILNKIGKLLPPEMELIKTHTTNPSLIQAKKFSIYAPFHEVITQHHERLDGSGYPLGLKGKDISIEAKIVAVADVYDAMSTDRPYRTALGEKAALEHILSQQGLMYDKTVVDALKKFLKLRFQYKSYRKVEHL
jgi:HD-GYP domain-containing protein (c-di-GMP phosphodiesterase class II)